MWTTHAPCRCPEPGAAASYSYTVHMHTCNYAGTCLSKLHMRQSYRVRVIKSSTDSLNAREQAASQAGGPTIDPVSHHERTTLPTPSTVAIIAAAAPIWDRGGSRPPWIRELATTPPAPIMPPIAADCSIRWTLQPMYDLRVQRADRLWRLTARWVGPRALERPSRRHSLAPSRRRAEDLHS